MVKNINNNMKTHDYGRFAKDYADLGIVNSFWLAYRDIPEIVKQHVKGKDALDYGCGGGRSTRFLKSLGFNAVGVDISADMIKEARQRDPTGEYTQIQSGAIPYDANSFDFIFSSIVFLEIPSLEEMVNVLKDMKRVLQAGGIATIINGTPEAYTRNWASFINDWPENRGLKSGDKAKLVIRGTDVTLYDYIWTDADNERAFKEAGLELLETRKPLAKGDGPFKWYSETEAPLWVIYTLKK